MTSGFQTLQATMSCAGVHLTLGSRPGAPVPSASPELALAGLLAEFEAQDERVMVVTLRLSRRDDATWAEPAVRWLAAHGRRVILRGSLVLPRPLVLLARSCGASVVLEMAHQKLESQRALLGPDADAASALLLQAQYLRRIGVPVSIHLGPLLAGLHDRPGHFEPLLRHIAAADVHDLHLTIGRLTPARLHALAAVLDAETTAALIRRYGVDPADTHEDAAATSTGWRLTAFARDALLEGLRGVTAAHAMRVDACGCAAHCHLDAGGRGEYTPVQGPDLFAALG